MNGNRQRILEAVGCISGLLFLCIATTESYGATPDVCTTGVAEPPFLSYGVDPNVLLMIDNSASMYDLAYTDTAETAGYCKDDSFASATSYQGYFDSSTWYKYDFVDGRFEAQSDNSACAGLEHSNSDVCLTLNTVTPSSTVFLAKGNFLNWAATSKFDIQKSILTGGKNEAVGGGYDMILESRGCSASRFVKEVKFSDGKFLTLGIRAPNEDERANADDNTTRIDIFGVSTTGFQDDQCKEAIDNLQDPGGQGLVSQPLQDCMGYDKDSPAYLADSNAAFNASIHNCWYLAKQGSFPVNVQDDINACENVYKGGALPASITPDDMAYVCSGDYDAATYPDGAGYVGRCWKPQVLPPGCVIVPGDDPDRDSVDGVDPDGPADDIPLQAVEKPYHDPFRGSDNYIYDCDGNFNANTGNCGGGAWKVRTVETIPGACAAGAITPAGWAGTADQKEECVLDALQDYCGHLNLPEVTDPTDLVNGSSAEFWNLPAVLVDSGVVAQLNQPVVTLRGRVLQTEKPSGLLQVYAGELRIGVMKFNTNGSATEAGSGYIKSVVPNQDGSQLLEKIDKGAAHTEALVDVINLVKADSWTPLAEAMNNAIAYYSQIPARLCNADDLTVDGSNAPDPIKEYCQDNHVVIITDGASSTDLHANVITMATPVAGTSVDGDTEVGECLSKDLFDPAKISPMLRGSTYFDDLTWFGKKSSLDQLYGANFQLDGHDKKPITTHIVVSGTVRDTGAADECNPKRLMTNAAINGGTSLIEAPTPELVRTKLVQTFEGIRAGASAGSAASVISSSRGGEGAVYQAIFWPSKSSLADSTVAVKWAGEVHSLFIDTNGYMYEDTNGDRKQTAADKRVVIYFDNAANMSKACYTTPVNGACNDSVDLDAVHYLWSANDWLAKISHVTFPPYDVNDQYLNRSGADYLTDKRRRYIFTWNDLDNDGIVDGANEILDFTSKAIAGPATTDWAGKVVNVSRRAVTNDFNVNPGNVDTAADNAEVNKIVEWIRGVEVAGFRSRTVNKIMPGDNPESSGTAVIWRLGDVVHSTPTVVARPMENLHLLYNDSSYANFVARWPNRRHMVYFGANDGMLHAVNAGFYDEDEKKFCLTENCMNENGKPELGAEMWAYVPYNLLPHLKCLTSPGYIHKYYVDQRPRIFDARIFTPDTEHPEGWGTVLVGSMRFGGARVEADRLSGDTTSNTDNRYFTSSYFLLDITNPEAPPVLLGEYTMLEDAPYRTDLGFTTPSPTPVVMKNNIGAGEWYLLLGSGPTAEIASDGIGILPIFDDKTAIKGFSSQKPKVAVISLNKLVAGTQAFRIPNTMPTANDPGVFTLDTSANGFVSDMISVDYDLNVNYKTDAVYFGTVEHGAASVEDAEAGSASYDDAWDGQLYRIRMRELNAVSGEQETTTPNEWTRSSLFNAHQPITAAPSVGTDRYNYWIYFGTGRFFDSIDKPDDAQQSYYGIKELTDCTGEFTWPSFSDKTGMVDVSSIMVKQAQRVDLAQLYCLDAVGDLSTGNIANKTCLPSNAGNTIESLGSLIEYIAGSSTTPGTSCVDSNNDGVITTADTLSGKNGWYRDLPKITRPRERNLGQATLLGGLLTSTTYQPYDDLCQQEGLAYLYGLYYQTGTSWYKTVFGSRGFEGDRVLESIGIGRGLATTPNLHVGSGDGPTTFVQTSTGEIIEMPQTNLPNQFKTGRQSWRER